MGFHDYAAIYAVPGLYERVFYTELGMRSAEVVVGLYAQALTEQGLDPAEQRVLDFGAGNGIGGTELRDIGVGYLAGLDLEPEARTAATRDRPGVYDHYEVGELGSSDGTLLSELRELRITALLALSAIGIGHVPPNALTQALGLLGPGGLFAFAVTPNLLPGSEDAEGQASGYPDFLTDLLDRTDELARAEYVHRRYADGSDHPAVALVGRVTDAQR